MRRQFIVGVEIPDGVSAKEMTSYIREAVTMWSKGTNPEDPIFEIGDRRVTVKIVKKENKSFSQGLIETCCNNERRNINGGCDNCGDPCL